MENRGNRVPVPSLQKLLPSAEKTLVHGMGRRGDTLLFDQIVEEADKPARHCMWRIRQATGGHYGGMLSDASVPISCEADGGRLHVAFAMTGR